MNFGYVKTGVISPKIKVGDTEFNKKSIINAIKAAKENDVELLVLPELCLTGATCGDLFFSSLLLEGAKKGLTDIVNFSQDINCIILVGLPIKKSGVLYNVCAVINNGKILSFVPKTNITEFDQKRYFADYSSNNKESIIFNGVEIPFTDKVLFSEQSNKNFVFAIDFNCFSNSTYPICYRHIENGATIIVNFSCLGETIGKRERLIEFSKAFSNKLCVGYIHSSVGVGESTTDEVFAGHNIIAENGVILCQSNLFSTGLIVSEIDTDYIEYQRGKNNINYTDQLCNYIKISFGVNSNDSSLTRKYNKSPFLPEKEKICDMASSALSLQSKGLEKRIEHVNANKIVIGLSGGLDSTLAIIVAKIAMQNLNRSTKDIIAVTMPCFGTTSRTFENTIKLAKALNVTLKKVDISKSVKRHLKDIGHIDGQLDVTFENSQARERTQVLMDIANMNNGIVLGTGDLSELALGWATYNGDHMSMYGVNSSIPKTLVRHLVNYYANLCKGKLKAVLLDILDTPVSPELLPPKENKVSQITEDIVGPYILHDFYLYNFIVNGFSPKKLYYIARDTFKEEYDNTTILKWLRIFIKRFFNQQFKRSCLPDGVKVGIISLSPRGGYKMPSDACCNLWLNDLENIDL